VSLNGSGILLDSVSVILAQVPCYLGCLSTLYGVDYKSLRIGVYKCKELEAKEQVRKDMQKFPKKGGFTERVAVILHKAERSKRTSNSTLVRSSFERRGQMSSD